MAKQIPAAAEAAIALAIRKVIEAGGDRPACEAVAQEIARELDRAGYEVRPGFDYVAIQKIDLGGRDRLAKLQEA